MTGEDGNARSSNRRFDHINHLASPKHDPGAACMRLDPSSRRRRGKDRIEADDLMAGKIARVEWSRMAGQIGVRRIERKSPVAQFSGDKVRIGNRAGAK